MKFEDHIYNQKHALYPGTEAYTCAWKHDAEVIDVPDWSSVERLRASLEGVGTMHTGVTWEGLEYPNGKKAAVAAVDLGDRPLGFCLQEDRATLAFEVPLLRPYTLGEDYHSVFIFSTLQRRYKLLTFALTTKHHDLSPVWVDFVVGYNEVNLGEVSASFTAFFAELIRQITETLEDLRRYDKAEKRKRKKYARDSSKSTEQMTQIREGRVRQREPWMSDKAHQRYLYNFGYALHEPDYKALGISEADTEKYLSDMGRYTVTVLYGGSWAEIIKAHPDYADGEPEEPPIRTF